VLEGNYAVPVDTATPTNYSDVNNGPLMVTTTNGYTQLPSLRTIYSEGNGSVQYGTPTSYTEMMGFPDNQLTTEYWIPWYNNHNMWTQLRFANTSTTTSTVVSVYLGNTLLGSYPLGPSQSTRVHYADLNGGPLKIVSSDNVPIIAAERILYSEGNGSVQNGVHTSYFEMMAFPGNQLTTEYWIPWYNNHNMWTQLRFANTSTTNSTVVSVYLGSTLLGSYPLDPSQSARVHYADLNGGPLKIVSSDNVPIIASERVIYSEGGVYNGTHTSYSELMAIPGDQLVDEYWFPWYNYPDKGTWGQVRFANTSDTKTISVKVYMGASLLGTYSLGPSQSTRVHYAGQNNGPLRVVSEDGTPIITAMRVIQEVSGTQTSYSEIVGFPDNLLTNKYWFPWYNNYHMDSELRISTPR